MSEIITPLFDTRVLMILMALLSAVCFSAGLFFAGLTIWIRVYRNRVSSPTIRQQIDTAWCRPYGVWACLCLIGGTILVWVTIRLLS